MASLSNGDARQVKFAGLDLMKLSDSKVCSVQVQSKQVEFTLQHTCANNRARVAFHLTVEGATLQELDVHVYAVKNNDKKNLEMTLWTCSGQQSKWIPIYNLRDFIQNSKLDVVCFICKEPEESERPRVGHLERIVKAFEQGKGNDTRFLIDGKVLEFAKVFLIASSSVFEAMFANEWKDTKKGEIIIEDADYETMKEFVRSLYLGRYEAKSVSEAFEVYLVADKYDVEFVKLDAVEFLKSDLKKERFEKVLQLFQSASDLDIVLIKEIALPCLIASIADPNVLTVIQVADQLNCEELRQSALKYLSKIRGKGQVKKLPGFDQLDIRLLHLVITAMDE